jgi:hypothetical protein
VADADITCDGRSGLRERTARARLKFLDAQPARAIDQLVEAYRGRERALAVASAMTD